MWVSKSCISTGNILLHTRSGTSRPLCLRQRNDRLSIRRCLQVTSSQGHVNHVITIMTLPSFTEFWNLYCPRTIHFSLRRRASLRTLPTTLPVRDWGNNGTICDSTCAARCHQLSRFLLHVSCYRRKNVSIGRLYCIKGIHNNIDLYFQTLQFNPDNHSFCCRPFY